MNKYEKAVKIKKEIADVRIAIETIQPPECPFPLTIRGIGESFLQSAVVRMCFLLEDVIDLTDYDRRSKPRDETNEA